MTNIDNFQRQLTEELRRYSGVVEEEMQKAIKESSQMLVDDLKTTSPKKTGSYRKGWKIKKFKKKSVVYNKTDYRLTHLLEKGHAKRGGGRVAAQVHIEPAEHRAVTDFLDRIERAIRHD